MIKKKASFKDAFFFYKSIFTAFFRRFVMEDATSAHMMSLGSVIRKQ